ncbi:uncharacterized protein SPPG_03233 [Spizellomyces punctatus DAOM BR117]|uniref:Uncharacterized protein n=1 Tax=Spizellomyces punctatus (strain DAOM BR117) TaxID=645134 RepID=A0A0L0HK68_SPIPD|nr:uncharacterized protein SPPG_03233 [Spizellomyces punctatus DAOM BR117]KND01428.1 hypothetical protein SPPG_03233 [Spizellomyces punctatus DAOM BR117]|eukprot:XP_016609467.1 hypothetical protein SPPG_03233 [Spizellomyces punctatus DAOM BR117]
MFIRTTRLHALRSLRKETARPSSTSTRSSLPRRTTAFSSTPLGPSINPQPTASFASRNMCSVSSSTMTSLVPSTLAKTLHARSAAVTLARTYGVCDSDDL